MAKIRAHVPIGLPISAVILLILGLVAGPVIEMTFTEEKLAQNVLLNAIPFIMIFVSIVLVYITLIWLMASSLDNRVSRRIHRSIEMILVAGIILGIVGMLQPWFFSGYRLGFFVLLISTLAYIGWIHVTPKGIRRRTQLGSVSITEDREG